MCAMGRLVHTGLGSSLPLPPPPANSFAIGTTVINTHTTTHSLEAVRGRIEKTIDQKCVYVVGGDWNAGCSRS